MTDGPSPSRWRRVLHTMRLRLSQMRRSERGQNMVEYSMVNWVLIMGLLMASTVKIIPGPTQQFSQGKMNVLEALLATMQIYVDGFVYVLNQPFP